VYVDAGADPELRQAVAGYYQQRYAVSIDPGRVAITPGASGALQLALGVLLNPGDKVLMADPGYPCNRHLVSLYEAQAVLVPVAADTAWQLTAGLLERHWQPGTRAVIVASPGNPTGTLIAPEELAAIQRLVHRKGAQLIVDEIYHGLVYAEPAATALALSDQVMVVNSFSKYFGMTGWRLGWCIAPQDYMPYLDRLAQNLFLAPSTPAQYAALAAFGAETIAILEQRRETFQRRRDLLLPGLRALGFDIPLTPQGAFYLYADSGRFADDSELLAEHLLQRGGVCVTPGRDFGRYLPERHLRFAYTASAERLTEGLERLRAVL
jgi:aspartate/methionine/tyrosine aminotransferase